jgi:hypothetical protein
MLDKAATKTGEHELYGRIIERKHQLEINSKLMNLQTIPLSDANIEQIQNSFKTTYQLITVWTAFKYEYLLFIFKNTL